MSINVVLASGTVQNRVLRYDEQSKPELRFVLAQQESSADGKSWMLWLPCCAVGSAAERLTEQLEDGMAIVLTSAKLCYRKRSTKVGEVSRLEILVWAVDVLSNASDAKTSDAGGYPTGSDHGALVSEERRASGAKRKPRYPKSLSKPWHPEHQN